MSLKERESVIEEFARLQWKMGEALREIEERKLYAPEYEHFPAYCNDRLDIPGGRAFPYVQAVRARDMLVAHGFEPPRYMWVLFPLVKLPEEDWVKVWADACERGTSDDEE